MFKIILNIYYKPVEQLKQIISLNKYIYIPINGGSSLRGNDWSDQNLLYDDVGENISNKNNILNEMTSIYWVHRHFNEIGSPDYIGFNHYRRFFKLDDIADYEQYDLIVSKPVFSCRPPRTVEWQYGMYHVSSDMDACVDVLRKTHPFFGNNFKRYIGATGVNFAPCNMFLMKKELFDEWCEFIFPILSKLENRIDLSNRDNYQKRALCFLTERMFGFWCYSKMYCGYAVKQVDIDERLEFKDNNLNERGTFN